MQHVSTSAQSGSSFTEANVSQPAQTIADGIEVHIPVQESVAKIRDLVDEIVLVSNDELIEAMRLSASALGLVLEPSEGAGLAAIRRHELPGERLATILTGSNIHPRMFAKLVEGETQRSITSTKRSGSQKHSEPEDPRARARRKQPSRQVLGER